MRILKTKPTIDAQVTPDNTFKIQTIKNRKEEEKLRKNWRKTIVRFRFAQSLENGWSDSQTGRDGARVAAVMAAERSPIKSDRSHKRGRDFAREINLNRYRPLAGKFLGVHCTTTVANRTRSRLCPWKILKIKRDRYAICMSFSHFVLVRSMRLYDERFQRRINNGSCKINRFLKFSFEIKCCQINTNCVFKIHKKRDCIISSELRRWVI